MSLWFVDWQEEKEKLQKTFRIKVYTVLSTCIFILLITGVGLYYA
jgi:hypothetical protein